MKKQNPLKKIAASLALMVLVTSTASPSNAMIGSMGNGAVLIVGMTVAFAGAYFGSNVAVMVGGLLGESNAEGSEIDLASLLDERVASGAIDQASARMIEEEITALSSEGPVVLESRDSESMSEELVARGVSQATATFLIESITKRQ